MSIKGSKLSEATKCKMCEAAHRRLATPEGRKQLRRAAAKAWETRRGLKESDELCEKRATIVQRRMQNPEERKKILACLDMASSRRGWLSEEHKAKISKAHKGRPKSRAHRQKLREISLGRKQSAETRRKRSETLKRIGHGKHNKGRKRSEATKQKMRAAQKRRFERPGEREKQAERNRRRWARLGHKHRLYDAAAEKEGWSVLRIWEHELAEGEAERIILTRANTCKRRNSNLSIS